jgi:hypothetical protein
MAGYAQMSEYLVHWDARYQLACSVEGSILRLRGDGSENWSALSHPKRRLEILSSAGESSSGDVASDSNVAKFSRYFEIRSGSSR